MAPESAKVGKIYPAEVPENRYDYTLPYFKVTQTDEKVLFLIGNIFSYHNRLEEQWCELEGTVVLNSCLAQEFENTKNITICHLGKEFYGDPKNPQEERDGKNKCLEILKKHLDQGAIFFKNLQI